MLDYILIGLLLVLVGVAGLQFTYMFYLDRLDRERKKHVRYLERRNKRLTDQLESAEQRLANHAVFVGKVDSEYAFDNELWADIID